MTGRQVSLPGELLLRVYSALDEHTGRWRTELDLCLAAGAALELEWAGRITIGPAQIVARDATPVDRPMGVGRMAPSRGVDARVWLGRSAPGRLADVRAGLIAAGLLLPVQRRRYGLFPSTVHLVAQPLRECADARVDCRLPVLDALLRAVRMEWVLAAGVSPPGTCGSGCVGRPHADAPTTAVVTAALSAAVQGAATTLALG